jgi:hypothetical protein
MKNEYTVLFSYFPDKTIINKMCVQNKAEVFFHVNVAATLSSGGTDFLILVPCNARFGPRKPPPPPQKKNCGYACRSSDRE